MNDTLWNQNQLAERLGVAPQTIQRWVREGHLPQPWRPYGPKSSAFWREATIDQWLEQNFGATTDTRKADGGAS